MVLHTSGTTGFPKPLVLTNEWATSYAYQIAQEPPEGFESLVQLLIGKRLFSLLPAFHVSLFSLAFCLPISFRIERKNLED